MTPALFLVAVFGTSLVAGLFGSLLGLGGGIVVVPVLTLLLGVDIRLAIAASLVAVVATSCGGAARYVRSGLANLRLGVVLEAATVAGALCGAAAFGVVGSQVLFVLFGVVVALVAVRMALTSEAGRNVAVAAVPDHWSRRLGLSVSVAPAPDVPAYAVTRLGTGLGVSFVAGLLAGLLGIGGGILKVPVMNLAMGVPLKAATATSNLTIGMTAAASAAMYLARGDIAPLLAAPVAVGVLAGATVGSLYLPRMSSRWLRRVFVLVMGYVALQMLYRGLM